MRYIKIISSNININNLIICGNTKNIKGKMYVHLLESENNKEILELMQEKYNVLIRNEDNKDKEIININKEKYYHICELCGKGDIYSKQKSNHLQKLLIMLQLSQIIFIDKVKDVEFGLEIVDYILAAGKEIICIKGSFSKERYLSNYLIKNGCKWI